LVGVRPLYGVRFWLFGRTPSRLLKKGFGKGVLRWRRCGEDWWGRFELRPQGE